MKVLLTGSNGQLGYDFKKLFNNLGIEYIATDYTELDITNDKELKKFFNENKEITPVINCAAYNDGVASKYDQAKYVLEKIGWKGTLGKAKTSDFNLPAKRAEYSKLDSSKVEKIPHWKDAINRFLEEME